MDAMATGGLEGIADTVMRPWFTQDYHDNCADAVAGWRAMLTRTPQAGYLAACAALRDADLTSGAKAIRAPTLCVVGDQDTSTPVALAREFTELIPAAKLEIVAGAAHLPCIEKPAILRALIEAHLKKVSP
jgi:3-oxoadipate enol-lactonase